MQAEPTYPKLTLHVSFSVLWPALSQSKSGHLEPPLGTPQAANILGPDPWNLML